MSPRGGRGGGPRSEDDRQRARLEREQRRAQREGRPVPRSLEDLPAAEPTIDPAGLGLPSVDPPAPRPDRAARPADAAPVARPTAADDPAPWTSADPGHARPAGDAAARRADAAPVDPTAPRPSSLSGQSSAAPRPVSPTEQPSAAPRPVSPTRPSPAASRPASTTDPLWGPGSAAPGDGPHDRDPEPAAAADPAAAAPASSSGPWWSRGAAAPPPPPAAPAPPPPARSAGPTPQTPGRPGPTAAPGTGSPTGAGRAETPGVARHPADRAGQAPPHGTARAAAAAGGSPPSREVENWFGEDETGEHSGDHAAAAGHGGRASAAERTDLLPLRPAGPAASAAPPTPPRKPTRRERRQGIDPATVHTRTAPARRGVSRVAAFLVLLILAIVIAGSVFLFQPLKGGGEGEVRVRIPPGSSIDDIGRLLKDRGVISNALAFSVRARISGDGANLKAGTLRLKKGMSYGAALTALQQDPLPPSVVRVSIPEGLSRSEVAATIKKAGVTGSYLTASARSAGFDPKDYGQPAARSGLEGFLFPATYELQRGGATSKALVSQQLKQFEENIGEVSMTRARRAKMSVYDVLIIASMIEREVRVPSERKLVAAVIYNRLEQNIALGIDATTRYAVKNWTRPLKQSEIDRKTPYDTRYRKGLPPTPIGSPGLASIKAAANPARSSYIYYVVRPCSDGRHNFATTNVEFEKDRAAYNAAQKRAGGDPSPKDAKGCPSR